MYDEYMWGDLKEEIGCLFEVEAGTQNLPISYKIIKDPSCIFVESIHSSFGDTSISTRMFGNLTVEFQQVINEILEHRLKKRSFSLNLSTKFVKFCEQEIDSVFKK